MSDQGFKHVVNLLKKLGLSIGDQGLYSATNFLLNILMVRWLSIEEYGFFALSFSLFLFFSSIHNSLILEPITVLATANHKDHLGDYLRTETRLNLYTVTAIGIVCIVSSFVAGIFSSRMGTSLMVVGLSTPFLLSYWFFRRICYIENLPHVAVFGSGVYSVLVLTGIFLMRNSNFLGSIAAFALMSLASLISSLVIWVGFRRLRTERPVKKSAAIHEVMKEQWHYGKWVIGVSILYWINSSISIPFLALDTGFGESGVYRSLQNLILPLQQIGVAIGNLFLPWFAAIRFSNRKQANRLILQVIAGFFVSGIIFIMPILIFPEVVLSALYGTGNFESYLLEARVISIVGLVLMINAVLTFILQARKKPNSVLFANLCGSIISIFLVIPIIQQLGLFGAVIGLLMTSIAILIPLLILVKNQFQHYENYMVSNE